MPEGAQQMGFAAARIPGRFGAIQEVSLAPSTRRSKFGAIGTVPPPRSSPGAVSIPAGAVRSSKAAFLQFQHMRYQIPGRPNLRWSLQWPERRSCPKAGKCNWRWTGDLGLTAMRPPRPDPVTRHSVGSRVERSEPPGRRRSVRVELPHRLDDRRLSRCLSASWTRSSLSMAAISRSSDTAAPRSLDGVPAASRRSPEQQPGKHVCADTGSVERLVCRPIGRTIDGVLPIDAVVASARRTFRRTSDFQPFRIQANLARSSRGVRCLPNRRILRNARSCCPGIREPGCDAYGPVVEAGVAAAEFLTRRWQRPALRRSINPAETVHASRLSKSRLPRRISLPGSTAVLNR